MKNYSMHLCLSVSLSLTRWVVRACSVTPASGVLILPAVHRPGSESSRPVTSLTPASERDDHKARPAALQRGQSERSSSTLIAAAIN